MSYVLVLLTFCTMLPVASQQVASAPTDMLINGNGLPLPLGRQERLPAAAPKALMRKQDSTDEHSLPKIESVVVGDSATDRPVMVPPGQTFSSGLSALHKLAKLARLVAMLAAASFIVLWPNEWLRTMLWTKFMAFIDEGDLSEIELEQADKFVRTMQVRINHDSEPERVCELAIPSSVGTEDMETTSLLSEASF